MHARVCVLSLSLIVANAVVDAQHASTISLEDGSVLPLAADARRAELLGDVDLYRVSLYLEGAVTDRAQMLSPDAPKALRIEVTWRDELRQRSVVDWRRELIPHLDPAATAHLRGTFAPLRFGDVVLIEYVPSKGTIVRVNKAVAVSGAHHDLMLAFLDHWLGQRPVSEELKRLLLG